MATLLIVHHTPSPSTQAMLEAVVAGAGDDAIEDVEVAVRPALTCADVDVLDATGYVLGTPANLGYMSGAMKHFFDRVYYPCLEATVGRPYGVFLHGNSDTQGAAKAVDQITTGLSWRAVHTPVEVVGEPQQADLDACWELGATVAATLSAYR